MVTEETIVVENIDRDIEAVAPALHHLKHAPFTGLGDDKAAEITRGKCAGDFAREAAGVVGIIETDIADPIALLPQVFGEMPHRREEEGDLLRMVGHIACLFHHLAEKDGVAFRIDCAKAGYLG